MRIPRGIRRLGRIVGIVLSSLLGLVLVCCLLLLARPVREELLDHALRIAEDALPGEFRIAAAAWPGLGRLELNGVEWTLDATTLASADTLVAQVDLGALWRKDLHVEQLTALGLTADVPAIVSAFAPGDEDEQSEESSSPPSFPRPGALPWAPSIAADSVRVVATSVAVADSVTLRATVVLGLDLLSGHTPLLDLQALDAAWIEPDWTARSQGLEVDLRRGELDGRLDLSLGPERDLTLALGTSEDRRFHIALAERGHDPAAQDPGVIADGSFTQGPNGMLASLEFEAHLRTPDMERIEALLGRPGLLANASPLGAVLVDAQGEVDLVDTVRTRVEAQLTSTRWPGRVTTRSRTAGSAVDLEELRLEVEGLGLTARGQLDAGAYTAHVEVELSSLEGVRAFVDSLGLPEDLSADLDLDLAGEGARLEPRLRLTASAPSLSVDSLAVNAQGRVEGPDTDLRVGVRVLAPGPVAAALDARILDLDAPRVHLAPLRVQSSLDALGEAPALSDRPTLRFDPAAKSVVVDALRVTGAAGELRLDADVSEAAGGRGHLAVEWPVPPTALDLAGFDAAARDSLLAPGWSTSGVPGLDVEFSLEPGARSGTGTARIELPAPWKVIAGLDPAAYASPNLLGTLEARWSEDATWRADLDLAETAWLDSAFVHAGAADGTTRLDSLLIKGGPARMTAAAQLDSNLIDGKFQLDLVPHPALGLLLPDLPADLQFLVNLRGAVQGRPDAPDARARLLASARSGAFGVPLLSTEVEVVEGRPTVARLELPEAASVGNFRIERARIELRPEDPVAGLIPLRLDAEIRGDADWIQTARLDSAAGAWVLHSDSLRVGARGRHLKSSQPFEVTVAPADSIFRVDGLELAGEPGEVHASIALGPHSAELDARVHLDASLPSVLVQMPPQMLPSGYHLEASGTESDLELSAWIEGLDLGTRKDILVRFDTARDVDQVEVSVHAKDALGVLATGSVTLPLELDLVDRRFAWRDGTLSGTVEVDSLPLPYKIGENEGLGGYLLGAHDATAPLLDARLIVAGTGSRPVGGALVNIQFPGVEELAEDRIALSAVWLGIEGDPASLGLFEDPRVLARLRSALPYGGVAASGALERAGVPRASLAAALPLPQGATSPIPGVGKEDHIEFEVSAEPLRLGEWNALVPRGTELGGQLYVSARGKGPIGDLPLDAKIRVEKARFQQSFGNSATLDGQLEIGGRSSAPVINGRIRVANALIRLPESSRELHPAEGEARLWALDMKPHDRFAALDTLAVDWGWSFEEPDTTDTDAPVLTLAESTRLDVSIEIPNSFWIRGQGLEVQLAGELQVELDQGVPRVVGELRAIGGSLEVVGARLRLDSGTVTFYGGDTTNPALDLVLTRDHGNVRVIVRVTGTALEPKLAFDSDPPMSQADIMSYLLFGSPSGELDGAQQQLLQDQAVAALSQFAAPVLENELTQSLGISMVQLQAGENPDEGLSLVVGKYVTPQILVKYEQSLKDRQKYTVEAEYWLNRNFRVESQLSESNSTGLYLNWSNDY